MLGNFLNALMWMPYHLQLAHGWTRLAIKINVVAVLVLAPAIFIIVPLHGAVGAAWVWVALNAGYVIVGIQLMHRQLLRSEKRRWYLSDVLLPSTGAFAAVWLASLFQPMMYSNRLAWLGFLMVTGLLALTASAVLADNVRTRVVCMLRRSLGWREAPLAGQFEQLGK
jgi:hypothetical protein